MQIKRSIETKLTSEKNKVHGLAAVYYDPSIEGTEYHLFGNHYERIARGAFANCVNAPGVLGTIEHNTKDPKCASPDTLALLDTTEGVQFEMHLDPQDPETERINYKIDKKIIRGGSFIADIKKSHWVTEGEKIIRVITELANLADVTLTSCPAYTGTVICRSAHEQKEIIAEYKAWQEMQESEARLSHIRSILEKNKTQH